MEQSSNSSTDQPSDESSRSNPLKRRTVLKMTGAVAVASSAMSGVASADSDDSDGITRAVFCGCSQVCACGNGEVCVIVAHETKDGFDCDTVTINDDEDSDFSFCYESEDRKVIAIEDGDGTVVCNPNEPCAGDALEDCDTCCDRFGQSGGPCGEAFLRTCGNEGGTKGNGPGLGYGKGHGVGRGSGRGRSSGRGR